MLKTILMVAAEPGEFRGFRRHFAARLLPWELRFAAEADFHGNRAILVANGPGMQLAGIAADVARRHVRPDAVVSTGYCGGLDPQLAAGDVFVASTIIDPDNRRNYRSRVPESAQEFQAASGPLVSVNRVANSIKDKQSLRSSGARVVEMEAAAVAARAEIWNVPFYCIRSVSDTAADGFGIDFNRMRDGRGRFSRTRIVLAALERPWSRIPGLISLARDCRAASQSLGDFFANSRF